MGVPARFGCRPQSTNLLILALVGLMRIDLRIGNWGAVMPLLGHVEWRGVGDSNHWLTSSKLNIPRCPQSEMKCPSAIIAQLLIPNGRNSLVIPAHTSVLIRPTPGPLNSSLDLNSIELCHDGEGLVIPNYPLLMDSFAIPLSTNHPARNIHNII